MPGPAGTERAGEDAREGARCGVAWGWDAGSPSGVFLGFSGVSLGFTRAPLRREQQAEPAGLPASPDEGKGSGDGGRGVVSCTLLSSITWVWEGGPSPCIPTPPPAWGARRGPLKLLLSTGDILKNVEVFGGTPASLCLLGSSWSFFFFWGVSIKAGMRLARGRCHPAATALSVPREDEQSPGAPGRGRGRERAEHGARQRGERDRRVPGSGPRSHAVMLFLGCRPAPGGGCSDSTLVPLRRSRARTGRSWPCAPGTVTAPRKVSPCPGPGLGPLVGGLEVSGVLGSDGVWLPWWRPRDWFEGCETLLVLGEGSGHSHAGTGGQREEEKQTKASTSGLSSGVTASPQMQKPWRSRC